MIERSNFIVIRVFEDKVPFGHYDVTYKYSVGKILNLRTNGRLAQKWIEKGYIKEIKLKEV